MSLPIVVESNQKSGKKLDRLANTRRTKQHTARLPNTEKKNLKGELETILRLSKQKVQSLLNMRTVAAREKLVLYTQTQEKMTATSRLYVQLGRYQIHQRVLESDLQCEDDS